MVGSQAGAASQSIDEIRACYEDEWLLIKMVDPASTFGEGPGEVIAHGPDRKGMIKAELKAAKRDPLATLAIVHGGKNLHDGAAFRRGLVRIAAEEVWVSVNSW